MKENKQGGYHYINGMDTTSEEEVRYSRIIIECSKYFGTSKRHPKIVYNTNAYKYNNNDSKTY